LENKNTIYNIYQFDLIACQFLLAALRAAQSAVI